MTSRMNSTSPGPTLSPGLTSTFQTLPGTIVSMRSAMILPPSNDARWLTDGVERQALGLGLVDADRLEAIDVARLRLAQLPEDGRRNGIGIDEAAHAGPVIHQDDRRLAGEVDGAQRIALVD